MLTKQHHRQFVGNGENKIEEFDEPKTKHYWTSHKKQSVNLVEDAPFTVDRQLEDQRLQIKHNRNPQVDVPTKADKSRSQMMTAKKGATRTIAMKARVLNKIVREESGQHTYTLVPPVPQKGGKEVSEPIDPETHPLFRPYALEAHQKPVIMSFGHRPSSASRTFNPATMKVRLRHGAVAKQEKPVHASGFGIPVSLLTKVLHAPDLPRPGDEELVSPKKQHHNGPFSDPNSLFPSEQEMQFLGLKKSSNNNKPASSSSSIPNHEKNHRGQPTSSSGSNNNMGERRVQSAHTPRSPQYEGSPGSNSSHERTIMSATGKKHITYTINALCYITPYHDIPFTAYGREYITHTININAPSHATPYHKMPFTTYISFVTHPVNTHCQHSLSPIANITSSHCICDTPFQRVCCDAWKMRNQNGQRYNIPFPSITHTSPSVTTQTQTMIHSHTLSHTDTHTIACTTSCYADKNDYLFTTSITLPPPPL